jgi:hypothetical protein
MSLVHALTGTDTDRLAEEKARADQILILLKHVSSLADNEVDIALTNGEPIRPVALAILADVHADLSHDAANTDDIHKAQKYIRAATMAGFGTRNKYKTFLRRLISNLTKGTPRCSTRMMRRSMTQL